MTSEKQVKNSVLRTMYHYPDLSNTVLGPVVRTPVSANPGLIFNQGFFFLSSKTLTRIIFYIFFRVSNHEIVDREN